MGHIAVETVHKFIKFHKKKANRFQKSMN
uniref:Uncharacterized protein n=1 Tax=Lepeophtheirus salmonis TaxID=72036 RepID=A0A0K2TZT0_LEPSM